MRDSSRSQVYAAEDLSAEHTTLTEQLTLAELCATADKLCASDWWRTEIGGGPVLVEVNRSGQRSFYASDRRLISLSPVALDLNTLCHELAHAACFGLGDDGASHGRFFCAVHVLVRNAVSGPTSGSDLAEVYGQFGLSLASGPAVPSPPTSSVLPDSLYSTEHVVGRPLLGGRSDRGSSGPIAL